VWADGVVTSYENKHTHKKQIQTSIDRASPIDLSHAPGLTPTVTTTAS
jgi:hypothetical protein